MHFIGTKSLPSIPQVVLSHFVVCFNAFSKWPCVVYDINLELQYNKSNEADMLLSANEYENLY